MDIDARTLNSGERKKNCCFFKKNILFFCLETKKIFVEKKCTLLTNKNKMVVQKHNL